MKYLSLFSGIEAASCAWDLLGWTPVGFSEIEPFACELLARRFPKVPNYGDVTKFKEWPIEPGSFDLLVGGSPCQAFSVAGLRKGLEDPRGNLTLTYLSAIDHFKPKWVIWENVPGVLSVDGGRVFGTFLGALGELGFQWAYRTLDAVHFGVPQRRRRVFVVARSGEGPHPGSVLFEPESLLRDPPKGRKKGKEAPSPAGEGVDERGLQRTVGTLCADTHPGAYSGQDAYTGRLIPQIPACYDYLGSQGGGVEVGISPTLKRKDGVAVAVPMVSIDSLIPSSEPDTLMLNREDSKHAEDKSSRSREILRSVLEEIGPEAFFEWGTGVAASFLPQEVLQRDLHGCVVRGKTPAKSVLGSISLPCAEVGPGRAVCCLWEAGRDRCPPPGWQSHKQRSRQLAAYVSELSHQGSSWREVLSDMQQAIEEVRILRDARPEIQEMGGSDNHQGQSVCISTERRSKEPDTFLRVSDMLESLSREWLLRHARAASSKREAGLTCRRLMPIECERLQGFPDGWTAIPYRGKPAADGPRYRALGNSMAVPVVRWIGRRIMDAQYDWAKENG